MDDREREHLRKILFTTKLQDQREELKRFTASLDARDQEFVFERIKEHLKQLQANPERIRDGLLSVQQLRDMLAKRDSEAKGP